MLYQGKSDVGQLMPFCDTSLLGHPGCLSPSLHSYAAPARSDGPVVRGQPQAPILPPPNSLHDFRESGLSTLIFLLSHIPYFIARYSPEMTS